MTKIVNDHLRLSLNEGKGHVIHWLLSGVEVSRMNPKVAHFLHLHTMNMFEALKIDDRSKRA